MSIEFGDFAALFGCIVLMVVGLLIFGKLMFDDDRKQVVTPPPRNPVPRRRKTDRNREPHWLDPALNFYGVECKGKDE